MSDRVTLEFADGQFSAVDAGNTDNRGAQGAIKKSTFFGRDITLQTGAGAIKLNRGSFTDFVNAAITRYNLANESTGKHIDPLEKTWFWGGPSDEELKMAALFALGKAKELQKIGTDAISMNNNLAAGDPNKKLYSVEGIDALSFAYELGLVEVLPALVDELMKIYNSATPGGEDWTIAKNRIESFGNAVSIMASSNEKYDVLIILLKIVIISKNDALLENLMARLNSIRREDAEKTTVNYKAYQVHAALQKCWDKDHYDLSKFIMPAGCDKV